MSGLRVGVVGDERLQSVVQAVGCEPVDGRDATETMQFVVAAGDSSLAALGRAGVDVPILAVDTPTSVRSVPFDELEAAITRVLDTATRTVTHPVVEATGSFDSARSLFDVALMAAEPARISEFSVYRNDERISRFRADGVVASTPAGSAGYNRNAGGPVVEPETGVASVVPIAPFAISGGHWVLSIDSVGLSIERDETPVELLADGNRVATIETSETISISVVDSIECFLLDESLSPVRS